VAYLDPVAEGLMFFGGFSVGPARSSLYFLSYAASVGLRFSE